MLRGGVRRYRGRPLIKCGDDKGHTTAIVLGPKASDRGSQLMRPVLLFDVNETVLDLAALGRLFEDRLGDAALRPQWFAQMLQRSLVGGLTDRCINFTDAPLAALEMVARRSRRF